MIQQSKIIVSFDLELLFTNILINTALQACLAELENDPSHPTAQHKQQVKSWTSLTLYGDLHTSRKMDQL